MSKLDGIEEISDYKKKLDDLQENYIAEIVKLFSEGFARYLEVSFNSIEIDNVRSLDDNEINLHKLSENDINYIKYTKFKDGGALAYFMLIINLKNKKLAVYIRLSQTLSVYSFKKFNFNTFAILCSLNNQYYIDDVDSFGTGISELFQCSDKIIFDYEKIFNGVYEKILLLIKHETIK